MTDLLTSCAGAELGRGVGHEVGRGQIMLAQAEIGRFCGLMGCDGALYQGGAPTSMCLAHGWRLGWRAQVFARRVIRVGDENTAGVPARAGDFNPVNVDPAFTAWTPFGRTIAHGCIAMEPIFQLVQARLGVAVLPQDTGMVLRYLWPCHPGYTIGIVVKVDGPEGMQFQCVNQRGAAECGAVAVRVLARDRGAGPGFGLLAGLPKPDPPPLAVAQGDASQIIHTSGTTSRPKGAVLGHHGGVVQGTLLAQPALETDARHGVRTAFYALPASDVEWRAFEARFGGRLIEGYGRSKTFGDLHIEPGFVRGDQAALHRVAGAGAAGPGGG